MKIILVPISRLLKGSHDNMVLNLGLGPLENIILYYLVTLVIKAQSGSEGILASSE